MYNYFRYRYSFIEGSGDGIFSIDRNNGRVFIRASGSLGVNFNRQRTHHLTVRAQNRHQRCQIARIRINIRVISNRIRFINRNPIRTISERASPGILVIQVQATGGAGGIRYSIVGGNNERRFRINSITGRLFLDQALNYETTKSYTLRIRAVSVGFTVRGEINININIQDVNEQPFFTTSCARRLSGCSYRIAENLPVTTLGSIMANDTDLSTVSNGMLIYRLSSNSLPFSINSAGILRTTRALNRETRSFYSFTLRVSDRCRGCALSATTTIRVTVNDVNDNRPVFTSNPTSVEVSEDLPRNTVVAEYRATDADVGTNAVIQFTLTPNAVPFSLSSTGTLSLTGSIDYETTQSYSVVITASNPRTSLVTRTTTTIQILNVNDNTPVITGEPYVATIQENSDIGTVVTTVTATDRDLGIHGEIRYFIISGNFGNSLAINSATGALTVNKNVDREIVSSFSLVVRAQDRGTPRTRRDMTTITITVSDVNDNAPIFRPNSYTVPLREDLPGGQNVIRVLATDADQTDTPNSNITYTLVRGNTLNAFIILDNGQIQINKRLDFEMTPSYSLVVEGRDEGLPMRSATATVMIKILNVNDNPPTLTGDQSVNISESALVGSTIATFQAQDQDQMAITLRIISGNSAGKFSIDTITGGISLTSHLDYETTSSYFLTIFASDGEQNTDSSLTVNVLNENEFNPVFSGQSNFMIPEESPAGTPVGTVLATDDDLNDEITYEFVGQNAASDNFILNSRTGVITTGRILDREALTHVFSPPFSQVTLQVTATDNGSPSRQNFRNYTVILLDINDNTPVITGEPYVATVQENAATGTLVSTITATDKDLGIHGEIRYFIISGNINNSFALNSITGALTVDQNIDRETVSFFSLEVRVSDRGIPQSRADTTTINITVSDVNDNAPIFRPNSYSVLLREDLPIGQDVDRVIATDADQPDSPNSNFTYTIISGNRGSAFRIFNNGQIQINQRLDFETTPSYNFVVVARDGGSPRRSANATMMITVININDNPPTLTGDQSVNISESAPVGSTIAVFQAQDQDQMAITINIISGNSVGKFSIISTTGVISLTAGLDYEITTYYFLTIRASDGEHNSFSSLTVRVLDKNEFNPVFSGQSHFMIAEESPAGTIVSTIIASDEDRNDEITYEFVGQNAASDNFILNSRTGVITTRRILDREALTQVFSPPLSQVTLQVVATDNGSPSRQTFRDYTVTLLDINDNTPVITGEPYEATVQENSPTATLVSSVTATDGDFGVQGEIRYFIISGNFNNSFALNSVTGALRVSQNIDRETVSSFSLVVRASDRGTPQTRRDVTTINITVSDVNDNAPIFRPNFFSLLLREDLPVGKNVVQAVATDADQPDSPNSHITYTIISGNRGSAFRILNNGQIQINQRLDYETTPSYNLVVVAGDGGSPRRSANATMMITVININDNPPTLTEDQTVNISESAPVGSTIAVFQAQDLDQMGITLSVISGNSAGKFSINSATGVITLTLGLNFEVTTSYSLTIRASDGEQNTDSSLTINVLDENEFNPVFSGQSYFTIAEESPAGATVGMVMAKDEDRNDEITYTFVGQNAASEHFILNSRTGVITTRTILDREALIQMFSPPLSQVTLQIAATDNGSPSRQSFRDYTITLADINDNTPVIIGEPYKVTLQENSATGTVVTTVTATDGDLGIHGEIQYFIISGNFDNYFNLDSITGALTVNQNIDREMVSSFSLVVRASDRGTPQTRLDMTTINITVSDVNDNAPIFRPNFFSVLSREDLPIGQNVVQVLATDADQPDTPNSNFTYTIKSGNTDNAFVILNNGQIQINQRLDFETIPTYSLVLEARDGGSPMRSANATVMITIINVNDNPPTLTGDHSVNISESAPVGSTISMFQAQDQDQMVITLSIVSGNSAGKFSINSTTGVITLNSSLDYESDTCYSLTIRASDGEKNTDSSLTVYVLNENEFNPVYFGQSNLKIAEESPAGTIVGTIVAFDEDRNDEITYKFVGKNLLNEIFILNSRTGVISSRQILDREALTQVFSPPLSQVTLQVSATDNGSPSRQSLRDYNITLVDINDNTPVITGEPYEATVQENWATGTLVSNVTAIDADLGVNGEIQYFIISGNFNNSFALNCITGALTVNQNIDRETFSSFTLVVTASDRGIPQSRTDTTTINITVSDVNDNAPIFRPNSYSVLLREDLPVGQNIVRVFASDADQPDTPNSNITYILISGNTGSAFKILNNGQIKINQRLDFEMTQSYSLVVEGRDGGLPMRSATATVMITVLNVNDNPPTLTGDQSVNISESAPVGSTIATFQAQDLDQMAITLSIISGNSAGKFSINSATGVITLVSGLDFESAISYFLTIRASDGEQNTDSSLKVNVLDENEFNPVFSGQTNFMIAEEIPAGTTVGTVTATDEDRNDEIAYDFLQENAGSNNFILNSRTGVITTKGILDREALTQVFNPPLSRVTLQVAATDNGSPSRQSFRDYTITLIDINDNTPVISGEPYEATILENSATGTFVSTVTATDRDLGIHGEIRYFIISGNFNNSFALNSVTGALTVNQNIDRETVSSFNLVVVASDRGTPQTRKSMTTVNIIVTDVNDNRPIFRPNFYSILLREDLPVGQHVVRVLATDADQPNTQNSNITYVVISGNTGSAFRIFNNGEIQINQRLDFEMTQSYSLVVEGRDGGLPMRSATATVMITILNVNDNPPTLTGDQSVNISESAPVGSTIATFQAQDLDQMGITLSIISGNSAGTFSINSTTGVITLMYGLDYELNTSYYLIIHASDGEQDIDSLLIVSILDENEFNPVFSGQANFMIAEESPAGTIVGNVTATDEDRNDEITYEFVREDAASNNFILNSRTGVITTKGILDRENLTQVFSPPLSQVTLQVAATDNGSPSRQSYRDYIITLVDINDNTPVITGEPYESTILENSASGTLVTTVTATDGDLGIHGEIQYFIISGNFNNSFSLNSISGALTVHQNIDRETISSFSLVVRASDRGTLQTRIDTTTINITMSDVNDNTPIFRPNSYSVLLTEDLSVGKNVVHALATDADQPDTPNSNIIYTIKSGNTGNAFRILNNGQIQVNQGLDFEITPSYSLVVEGRDGGSPMRSATVSVIITIINVNEYPPTLTGDQSVNISESAPVGSIIAVFQAQDQDQMAITLNISSSNSAGKFSIDSTTGIITLVSGLDYESNTSYFLTILASDGEKDTFSSLTVNVMDENEFNPQFSGLPNFIIAEESPAGTIVGNVIATDEDRNDEITYELVGQNAASESFILNSRTGVITTSRILDRETLTQVFSPPLSQVTLQVAATDNGSPSRQNFRDYTITLEDINDNTPFITDEPYVATVQENSPTGTFVSTLIATDGDLGVNGEIRYFIISGNFNNSFSLNSITGALTVNQSIDREIVSSFSLDVKASDRGIPQNRSDMSTINITVSDVNDNAPIFTPDSYSILLREDLPVGQNVVRVLATDADQPDTPNSNITYTVINTGNSNSAFKILNNGQIEINQRLDFEMTQSYRLVVEGRDEGLPMRSATATVMITVLNVNDNPPTLTGDQSVNISESAPVGSTIAMFEAQDQDQMAITISILSGNSAGKFSINLTTGVITITSGLDYESKTSYFLTIRASDGEQNTESALIINVLDENEFNPVFSGQTNFMIAEESPAGTIVGTVTATDEDRNDEITYEFIRESTASDNFILNSRTGVITTRRILDREALTQVFNPPLSQVSLQVAAIDNGSPSRQSFRDYIITLVDINDNTPMITGEPYEVTVLENSATGTVVTTITATDGDLGIQGEIRYFIISGNINNSFALNSLTGALIVNHNIDREAVSSFRLVVGASDRGTPQTRRDMATINITVSDVNDNAPIFRPDAYSVQLREDLPAGQNIVQVLATDADQPDTLNSDIIYTIFNGNTGSAFRILSNGQIQSNQRLDFEITPSYSLVVEGRDGGSPMRSATVSVIITIINVNEYPPTLTGDHSVNISESAPVGSTVAVFQAQDQDQMAITLSITSGNASGKFSIDSRTGVITLVSVLDYESITSYFLTIQASDGEQNTDSSLTVNVIDENEFEPLFSGPLNFVIAEESPAGTIVGNVLATDEDRNDVITYELVGQNAASESFILNLRTGVITTSRILDRETLTQVFSPPLSQVTLQVAATDNGSPSRQNFRDYTITLEDINDNTPVITSEPYEASVQENSPTGTFVSTLIATDGDFGVNGEIRYFIISGNFNNSFTLNSITGALTVNQHIDRETVSSFSLVVKASDRGIPQNRSDISAINITVSDVNDNAPVFTPDSYSVLLREDLPVGQNVVQVLATDADQPDTPNSNITYIIISGNSNSAFKILNNGQIEINQRLDFEMTKSYSLIVAGRDEGLPMRSATATVMMNLLNVNDNPPTLTGDQSVNISESAPVGSTIAMFEAQDQDQMAITISILSGNSAGKFSINLTTGVITLTSGLDYESNISYFLTIRASDGEQNTESALIINVLDVNEFNPVFSGQTYFMIAEEIPAGRIVGTVTATDEDRNDEITYEFIREDEASENFILNSRTGVITTSRILDREALTKVFNPPLSRVTLQVAATDNGSPSRQSFRGYIITLVDINDNTPVITGEPYEVTVQENSAIGTVVSTITATDRDLGIHGEIQYFIISGNFNNSFALNSLTGALIVNYNIDREAVSSFCLVVGASDRGTPQTTRDMATINITVTDVNDNAPIFRPDTYSVQLREDLPAGQNVIQVLATDADQPDTLNSYITYTILNGNTGSAYRILSNGQIQSNQRLDFEIIPSYSIVVEGRDGGSPMRSATVSVIITIINVNEYPPMLTGDQYVNISESAPVGSTVAVFQAQDQDQMVITLSIISGNSAGKFSVNSTTGVITLVSGLDYESTTSYFLAIRASDGEQNTDSSLSVNVIDENEFNPLFSGQLNFVIAEESPVGTIVGNVLATDEDRNDEITYELVGQNAASESFILNSTTGVISTKRILNRETLTQVFSPPLSQVTLQVAATDNGSPSRQSFRDYTITLVDINDNTPTFSDTKYTNQLRENLPSGQVVFSTSATDIDLGTNAQITYSFRLRNNQGPSNPFQINSATGTITTTIPLDCELQPFYLFSITATDAGSPPMSSTVIGNLTLIDENDNSPQFSQTLYFQTVSESLTPGTTIMTFLATDADKGFNGEVQYYVELSSNNRFIEGEEDVEFMIDVLTGRLYAINTFDYERNSQVNVTVFANDRGLPRRTTSALLIISVTNVDEDPPFFLASMCSTSITISENVAVNTTIGYCNATDQDTIATGSQFPITYSLNNQFFDINPNSGAITTTVLLDRERSNSVIGLNIQATDLANQVASREIRVSISDVNDNPPQFVGTPYYYNFTDSAISDNLREFMSIQATDPDAGNNGTFTFKVGKIIKLTETETNVLVIAQDNGVPSLSSSVNVTVTFQSPCQLQFYTISNNNGEGHLSAQILCSVVVTSSSMVLTLGMSDFLTCRIIRNTIAEFQWLHNGTSITNSEIVETNTSNIRFSNAGQYACRVSSNAGSLQSVARRATIQSK